MRRKKWTGCIAMVAFRLKKEVWFSGATLRLVRMSRSAPACLHPRPSRIRRSPLLSRAHSEPESGQRKSGAGMPKTPNDNYVGHVAESWTS